MLFKLLARISPSVSLLHKSSDRFSFLTNPMNAQFENSIWKQLERASISELTLFLTLTIIGIIVYALFASGFARIASTAFRTPGPKAYPLIGNCLLVKEPDRK